MKRYLLSTICTLMMCILGQGILKAQFRDSRPIRELTDQHQSVAILPPDAVFWNESESPSEIERQQVSLTRSIIFQQDIYNRLTRASLGKIKYQPIELTNRILSENNIDLTAIAFYEPAELGKLLGVDAVLVVRGNEMFARSKSHAVASTISQIAIAPVAPGSNLNADITEVIRTHTELWDTNTAEKVWNYDARQYRKALFPKAPERQWMGRLAKAIPYSY
jgi:hypothetical protein